jgi:hypothetical protein
MLTDTAVQQFAEDWIASWNAHDLDRIVSHYAPGIVLVSPVAQALLNDPHGTVRGLVALRAYFKRGLEAYPGLTFTLEGTYRGLGAVVLCYVNHTGRRTAEVMEFDAQGRVVRVLATYSGVASPAQPAG